MPEAPSILIVDSNVGFAAMLKEGLEQDGEYQATVTHGGREAVEMVSQRTFDLAVVDLGIDPEGELDGEAIARKLRDEQPGLRLMLIPIEGDKLPEDLADLDVQGTLPKPFFLPDLPRLVDAAMAAPTADPHQAEEVPDVREERARTPAAPTTAAPTPKCSAPVMRELDQLAQELNAYSVLVTREGNVLGSVGRLNRKDLDTLAQVVTRSSRLSREASQVVGGDQRHFEQSVEGREHMLYSLAVIEDVILSVVLRPDVTLGLLRHRVRATAKLLRALMTE